LVRRLFSLTGVVPLGVFLVVHVVVNARAVRGEQAFAESADALARIPALPLVELLFVLLPLVVHAAIGLWLVASRQPLAEPSPYPPGVAAAMRVTGLVALAFLAMHLPELRFRGLVRSPSGGELATRLAADLSSTWHGLPWRGAAYLLASACIVFHFAAGLWGFFARTRRGSDDRARRWAALGVALVGSAMWLLLVDAVVFHATGARLFGSRAAATSEIGPCPPPAGSAR
jgi:succinate dehydrogenase/fumarate reductase cytochrome b subunit (b558 family)